MRWFDGQIIRFMIYLCCYRKELYLLGQMSSETWDTGDSICCNICKWGSWKHVVCLTLFADVLRSMPNVTILIQEFPEVLDHKTLKILRLIPTNSRGLITGLCLVMSKYQRINQWVTGWVLSIGHGPRNHQPFWGFFTTSLRGFKTGDSESGPTVWMPSKVHMLRQEHLLVPPWEGNPIILQESTKYWLVEALPI